MMWSDLHKTLVTGDPIDFLSWFLNALHIALNGNKSPESSVIYRTFLGAMRIRTRKIPPVELEERQRSELLLTQEYQESVADSPFLYLTCDLPPPPLFKDEIMENIIPQVSKQLQGLHDVFSMLMRVLGIFVYHRSQMKAEKLESNENNSIFLKELFMLDWTVETN